MLIFSFKGFIVFLYYSKIYINYTKKYYNRLTSMIKYDIILLIF